MKIEEQDEETRAALAYEARKLTEATERLLKLCEEFSLLPIGVADSGFAFNLVSQPDEKRVILCVDWE